MNLQSEQAAISEIVGSCALEGIRLSEESRLNVAAAVHSAEVGAEIRQRLVEKYRTKAQAARSLNDYEPIRTV